jgi:DNA modification methylase
MTMEGFYPEKPIAATKGKNIDALRTSEVGRNKLIALFGGVENIPSSVMRAKRPKTVSASKDEPASKRTYEQSSPGIEKAKDPRNAKILRDAYYISGRGCGNGALSTFPQNIGRSMVILYSEPGDTVFDPFAGHASRISLVVRTGRNYIGCDICNEFMEFNNKLAVELREQFPEQTIKLIHGDSRSIDLSNKVGDMTITSPPYWRQEEYGNEPEQMSKCKTYEDFLESMQLVMNENYRILRRGAYAVWFINDFRDSGKFRLYHVDIIRLGENAGFTTNDIVIVDLGNSIRDCFTNQIMQTRIIPKRHEYGIVFRKPEKQSDNKSK